MSEYQNKTESRISIPIEVVLERTVDRSKRWSYPTWAIVSLASGQDLQQGVQCMALHDTFVADSQRFFYSGLVLDLFKDGSEGYWYNLLSADPYIFVVCEGEQEAMEVRPFYVTVNQDEATGHLESEDIVLSAPMPTKLRALLERYVVEHYKPEQQKKRKRKNWLENSLYAGVGHDKKV